MADSSGLLRFLNEVESDVTAESRSEFGDPGDFREIAFTGILTDQLEAAGVLESPALCYCAGGKSASSFKVNGYAVPEEDSALDLFVTHYFPGPHDVVPTLNASEVEVGFNKLERFFAKALDGLHENFDVALPERRMAERVHQLKGKIDRVNFFFLSNARLAARQEKKRKAVVAGMPAAYEVWDIERLRRLRESGAGYEALMVDMRSLANGGLQCVVLDGGLEEGYRTCVAIFPGSLLRDLYDEHGSRLLELNVRSYLQAKGKINKQLLETLRGSPQDFMAYNNGITVVAEEVVFGPLADGAPGILELRGMQIVNGGQTTASIHRAAKEFDADVSKVFVQGKVVTVAPERFNEVVPLISRYANSQNKVTEPDLQANHRFHVGIERVSKREWSPDQKTKWFYERARGSYQTARSREGNTPARLKEFDRTYPVSQRFTKEDLARFENCWRGAANIVNRGAQKNFVQFMTVLKNERPDLPENWEPSAEEFRRLVAKAILFRDIQRIVKSDTSITGYRINIAVYTASLLAERSARRIDLDRIWKHQKIGDALEETVKDWAPVIFRELLDYGTRKSVHIDNVLKSEETWKHILGLDLQLSKEATKELVSAASVHEVAPAARGAARIAEKLNPDDENNIARCIELDAAGYTRLIDWAKKAGAEDKKIAIAGTLAGFALLGWPRSPTKAQAWHVAQLIRAARDAGAL
jgi:hypothetical protein